ncbi:MAG: MscL family protein [Sulfuricella sp.]|nr:MscL family protein [Sulfuricella sp.]
MSMVSEFKEFTIQGNMIDMAVGVIVGAAPAAVGEAAK